MEGEPARTGIKTKSLCYTTVNGSGYKWQRRMFFIIERYADKIVLQIMVFQLIFKSSEILCSEVGRKSDGLLARISFRKIWILLGDFVCDIVKESGNLEVVIRKDGFTRLKTRIPHQNRLLDHAEQTCRRRPVLSPVRPPHDLPDLPTL